MSHSSTKAIVPLCVGCSLREDDSRVRTGHAAENLGLAQRLANSLLQQEKSVKIGVKNKQLKAARSTEYLLKVINKQ